MTEFFSMFAELFSFVFIRRALVVGILVSLCAALLWSVRGDRGRKETGVSSLSPFLWAHHGKLG